MKRRPGARADGLTVEAAARRHMARLTIIGEAALRRWRRDVLPQLPRCGAKTRVTGEPCKRLPEPGRTRCRYHGGKTPKGAGWHRPQFHPSADPKKADKKLADLARREKKRRARLAAMTPEERARYEAWHAARRPGGAAARRMARQARDAAALVRELLATEPPPSDDAAALAARIRELEAEAERLSAPLPVNHPRSVLE